MKRLIFEAEHEALREPPASTSNANWCPNAEKWEEERIVDRSAYVAAGKYGLIGFNMPEEYGGGGSDDFRFNAVIDEEIAKARRARARAEPAQRRRRTVLQGPGQRRAEEALAARHRQRRD